MEVKNIPYLEKTLKQREKNLTSILILAFVINYIVVLYIIYNTDKIKNYNLVGLIAILILILVYSSVIMFFNDYKKVLFKIHKLNNYPYVQWKGSNISEVIHFMPSTCNVITKLGVNAVRINTDIELNMYDYVIKDNSKIEVLKMDV